MKNYVLNLLNYILKIHIFSQTKTIDLRNIFFKYFILIYIQYKNEETTDFWNRMHNVSDEVLFAYNNYLLFVFFKK